MSTCIRSIAALIVFVSAGTASAQTDVVTNGSFETSAVALTGWSTGPATTPGGTGTCGFNAAAAPGTETVTSTPGFAAAQGANLALASTATTGGANYDCVLYQDVAIPAGATTATFSGSWGVKLIDGLAPNHGGVFAGVYATTKIPNYLDSTLVGSRQVRVPGASDAAFATFADTSFNVSSVAGTTVRLALHVVTDQTVGRVVAGFDNIQLMVTVLTVQTITGFAPTSPVVFGAVPATLTATGGASGNPIVFTTTSAGTICTVSGSTVTFAGVGVCNLRANQAGNGSYSAAPQVTASITINAAAQTIAGFAPTTPVVVGAAPATLTASGGASGNPIVFATTSASTICTVSGSTVTFVGVGVCNLTANQAASGSYSAAPQVTASITINAAAIPQSIPTLSEWGLIILSGLLVLGTWVVLRRRQI